MNEAAFSLVLLAAGYIALRYVPVTRHQAFRTEGHALYFLVVAAAIAASAFTILTLHEVSTIPRLGITLTTMLARLVNAFGTGATTSTLGTVATLSVPLVFVTAMVLELPLRYSSSLRAKLLISLRSLGELEEFLWTSAAKQLPVMLTMSSGKVYVGTSIDATSLRDERRWLRLEPLLSGYRDDRHRFQPVTSYAWIHASDPAKGSLAQEDFDVLLPLDDVQSVHAFDLTTYAQKFDGSVALPVAITGNVARCSSSGMPKAVRFYLGYVATLLSLPLTSFLFGTTAFAALVFFSALLAFASAIPEEP